MRKKGSFLIAMGLLLLAAALLLTGYNLWDSRRAGEAAQTTVEGLRNLIPVAGSAERGPQAGEEPEEKPGEEPEERPGEEAEKESEEESEEEAQLPTQGESREEPTDASEPQPTGDTGGEAQPGAEPEPDARAILQGGALGAALHSLRPVPGLLGEREMPTVVLNGYRSIGILEVDSLGLSLPVMDQWDYDRLRVSPCRFAGNVYEDDLVICAHNYAHHFYPLKYVPVGTEVRFTDAEGSVFTYAVTSFDTVGSEDVERMISGDWDLTLFTCNTNGQTRCAIRCDRIG